MERLWFGLGAVSALLAVALGAFGAHALRARLSPDNLAVFQTGVQYQMFHGLALLAVAYAAGRWGGALPLWAGILFLAGTVLFSGSLYLLTLTGARVLGPLTPVGGLAFLAGWVCLAATAVRG
jgi:uncharacterized membrane protein YgdD (TMEM256/DUF423 family)